MMVRLDSLSAGYGGVPVIRDIDLTVGEGEIVGLMGPNGAGKTTTLLAISGLVKPLGGEIEVLGSRPSTRSPFRVARAGTAHVTESRNVTYCLTVAENLRLAVRGSRASRQHAIGGAYELFPALAGLKDREASVLSGGEQQMLALACGLVAQPKLLLLDEMSLGLAPIIVEQLLGHVRQIVERTGCSVILVEQHIPLALETVDRGYIMSHGEIVIHASATELAERTDAIASSYLGEVALEAAEPNGSAGAIE